MVEALRISRNDILHIVGILQPAFDLKRRGTGIGELLQGVDLTQVFHRQQVTVADDRPAVGIDEVVLHAAHLRARPPVGRTAEEMLRGIALSRITHAEGAMDKDLELHVGHSLVDRPDLLERQFARQHGPCEAEAAEPSDLLRRAVVHLC